MIDTLDMREATLALPDHIEAAASVQIPATQLPSAETITSVVVFGMGGSGIAGDVLAAVLPESPVPIIVNKGYECPGFVGPGTLAIAASFSGNTEETLAAVGQAAERGATVVVLSAGGRLSELAATDGFAQLQVDPTIPMPRAALGALVAPLLVLMGQLGFAVDAQAQLRSAVEQLHRRRSQLTADPSLIQRSARKIGRTLPIIYGAGAVGSVAAIRWKGQFNENPKVAAFANRIPELTHNEICGWAQHGDVTRQVFSLLLLRHDYEHAGDQRRFDLVAEFCDEVVADVVEFRAQGDGRLAQLLDLVLVGDLITLECAANEGVDPGPVPILDDIKARLSQH